MSNPNPPKSMSKPPPPRPQRPPSPGLHSAHFELGPESDDDASDSASDSEERQSPTSISSSPLSIRRQRIYGQGKHTSSSFLSGLADSGNAFISDLQQKRNVSTTSLTRVNSGGSEGSGSVPRLQKAGTFPLYRQRDQVMDKLAEKNLLVLPPREQSKKQPAVTPPPHRRPPPPPKVEESQLPHRGDIFSMGKDERYRVSGRREFIYGLH